MQEHQDFITGVVEHIALAVAERVETRVEEKLGEIERTAMLDRPLNEAEAAP